MQIKTQWDVHIHPVEWLKSKRESDSKVRTKKWNSHTLLMGNGTPGVPLVAQWKQIWRASVRTQVQSLASLSGLGIRHFCEPYSLPGNLHMPLVWRTPPHNNKIKNGAITLENGLAFSLKCLLCDSATPLLGIYPREMKPFVQKRLFIKSSFIIVRNWKQPICQRQVNDKPIAVYLLHEILLGNEKEQTTDTKNSIGESQNDLLNAESRVRKERVPAESAYWKI